MLRLAALLLLLANLAYYGWAGGWLAAWGLAPQSVSEPERVARQIAPERLQVLPKGSAAPGAAITQSAPAPAPAPAVPTVSVPAPAAPPGGVAQATQCLQAGPWDEARADALRVQLAPLPPDSWHLEPVEASARWMVYIGPLADEEAVARKRAELRALQVSFDRPAAALEPGLSLGRFSSEEAAQRGLAELATRGVRTAHVVRERNGQLSYVLRLPATDTRLREQLDALGIAWGDTPPQICR